MKDGIKVLVAVWGCWVLFGIKAAPHRHNSDIGDTTYLILFGLFTLFALAMTVRFVYRLVTSRDRISKPSN